MIGIKTSLLTCISLSFFSINAETLKLRIMETTDLHVHMADYDYYQDKQSDKVGLARVSALITQARSEVKNTLLIDNGDLLQGNPLGDYIAKKKGLKKGDIHPVYKAMNLLHYDAGNIGNHEFNYGLKFLKNATAGANFPYTVSNIYVDDGDGNKANDKPLRDPYLILEKELVTNEGKKQKIKIGIIGFTPPQIMQWDKANLEGKVWTADIVDTANKYVPKMLKKGADIIIAVSHSGASSEGRKGMEENASAYLSKVKGINAILFGHAHTVFPSDKFKDFPGADISKGTLNGIPATMPGFWGSHLGLIDLNLEKQSGKWKVTSGMGSVRGIYKREGRKVIPRVVADARIINAVQEEHQATIAYMRESVGKITAPINSYFALVNDDPSIQIVSNAQKWYVERLLQGSEYNDLPVLSAAAPFKSGGRGGAEYYTSLKAGEIAFKNVADLYIYPNTLRVVRLTGAQVREWLEMSAGQFNQIDPAKTQEQALINPDFPSYNFDVIDGIQYQIDLTQPARYNKAGEIIAKDSHRISNITFQGKALNEKQVFAVATNNYRASGGGHFPALDGSTIIIEAPDENRTILANYIFEKKTINPSADNNWHFKPMEGKPIVTFISSPSAIEFAKTLGIEMIGEAEDGFLKYKIPTSAKK